jgi:hypothetical protein
MEAIKRIKFLLILAAGLVSGKLLSATYYVSSSGNDANSGTSMASAWKTISKVNSMALPPGTIVLFEGGATFSGGLTFDSNDAGDAANKVVISSYGTGKAIISSGASRGFYAYNSYGFTLSNLVFQGAGMNVNTTAGVFLYMDLMGNVKLPGITFKNVDVHDYGKTGIWLFAEHDNAGYKDVLLDNVHVYDVKENGIVAEGFTSASHMGWSHQNIIIKNTEVNNVPGFADPSVHRGSGIILSQVDNALIEKSVAHDNGAGNTHCGGPGGIWAWDANNVTIQFCESYSNKSGTGCDGLGFDLDGGITNSILQYNYSHDNDGAGYLLGQYDNARPWANNVVRYNISENDGRTNSGGITLFKGAGTTMSGLQIYNNTVYTSPSAMNTGLAAFGITDWHTGITGVEVYNNIFQSTGSVKLVNVPTGYDAVFAGNLYWASGGTLKIVYHGTTYSTLAAWRTATGNEQSGGIATGIIADPFLAAPGSGGILFPAATTQLNSYKITNSSPAADAGLDLQSLYDINRGTHDFFGNAFTAGALADIGAHEVMPPLTTGVETAGAVAAKEIAFYPNPVRGGDAIAVKNVELPYSIELVSMTGSVVLKDTGVETDSYFIPMLAGGIYVMTIVDANGKKMTTKLMVQ